MIDMTGPPSTISASPRPQPMPQRLPNPARKTTGRNASPDHRKRCMSKSAGVNPSLSPCRVATKPSAQNSAAPRPHATPSRAGFGFDLWVRVPAPPVGSFIADAYVSPHSGSTHGPAGLARAPPNSREKLTRKVHASASVGSAVFQIRELAASLQARIDLAIRMVGGTHRKDDGAHCAMHQTGTVICPTGNVAKNLSSPSDKKIPLRADPKSNLKHQGPVPDKRGASRSSRT